MLRWTKRIVPVAGLVLILGLQQSHAQDTPAPAAGKATVTVTVVDEAGKPVAKAKVNIYAAKPRKRAATSDPAAPATPPTPMTPPEAVGKGTTGEDGTVAITGIPDGSYNVNVRSAGMGGRARVIVADGKDATADVTVKARPPKPATAPN